MKNLELKEKFRVTEQPTDHNRKGFGSKTILFNDDVHTFEDVAAQLSKAIRKPYAECMKIAHQVHRKGCEVVFVGHVERCEAVAMVLEEIKLRVVVEKG